MSPPGTYVLSITATSGSLTTTIPFPLTIADRVSLAFRRGDGGGFSETDDVYIQSGAPGTNYGAETKLFVDAKDCIKAYPGSVCKTLLKFPAIFGPAAGQIPTGSRIVNASLGLTVTNSGVTEDAYQITGTWSESAATWNTFSPPGLPGTRTPKITFLPTHVGRLSLNLTPIAQRWAGGQPNEGILLTSTNGDVVDYNSSESVRDRPSLIVQFVPPPSPLVLAYDMESLTQDGRMQDRSGNGNHGTMTGTTDIPGRVGRARHINTGERITAPEIPVTGLNFTVAAWFNWTANPSPYYGGIQGGGCCSWELRVRDDGRFAVVFYQAIQPDILTQVASRFAYNDGTWHHAAGVLRSGLAELYVDGALVAQDTTDPITSVRTSTLTEIGHVASDFVGEIDEVRVYSRALTAPEIASMIIGTTQVVQTPLESHSASVYDPISTPLVISTAPTAPRVRE